MKAGELILASTSPYRRALLDRLGIPYRAIAPDVDEEEFKRLGFGPRKLARKLAIAKAKSVSQAFPEAIVIGCDQVVTIDGQCLGKPGTEARAIAQLLSMQGKTHRIITAMSVCQVLSITTYVDVAKLKMRKLAPDEFLDMFRPISRWIARGLISWKAGELRCSRRSNRPIKPRLSAFL